MCQISMSSLVFYVIEYSIQKYLLYDINCQYIIEQMW